MKPMETVENYDMRGNGLKIPSHIGIVYEKINQNYLLI